MGVSSDPNLGPTPDVSEIKTDRHTQRWKSWQLPPGRHGMAAAGRSRSSDPSVPPPTDRYGSTRLAVIAQAVAVLRGSAVYFGHPGTGWVFRWAPRNAGAGEVTPNHGIHTPSPNQELAFPNDLPERVVRDRKFPPDPKACVAIDRPGDKARVLVVCPL